MKNTSFLFFLVFSASCSQVSETPDQISLPEPSSQDALHAVHALDRSPHGDRGGRWEHYFNYIYIQYDREYLDILRAQADAEIKRAESEAAVNQAVADAVQDIRTQIQVEMLQLNASLRKIHEIESLIRAQSIRIDRAVAQGRVDAEFIAAVSYLSGLLKLSAANLLTREVAPLAADQFGSAGAYRIEKDENGQSVIREISGSNDVAFAGGSLGEYLKFLSQNRLVVASKEAKQPLIELLNQLQQMASQAAVESAERRQQIRLESEARFAKLTELITELVKIRST